VWQRNIQLHCHGGWQHPPASARCRFAKAPHRLRQNGGTDLLIEWKLAWELSSSADAGVRLLPTLAGSAQVSRIKLNELGPPEDEVVNDFRSK
jgi:hypothetical protein